MLALLIEIETVEPVLMKGTRGYEAWVLVRVRTNQGTDGTGECFSWAWSNRRSPLAIADKVRAIGRQLQGAHPLEIGAFLERFSPRGAGREWRAAISGIEIALWDVLGQVAGLPIYSLLGGRVRERIPLYANHGVFGSAQTAPDRIERVLRAKEMGFQMFKWDPFGEIRGTPDSARLGEAIAEVQAFRERLGAGFDLAIDAHGRFSLEGALMVARELEPLDITFFEEPVDPRHPEQLKRTADATPIPIAVGENICTRKGFKQVLDTGAVRILQPEVGTVGGILETVMVAAMADAYDVQVAPHNWCGPVLTRALAHVSAALPGLLAMEYASTAPEDQWENDLLDPPSHVEDGEFLLSDRPGLGSKLNEAAVAARCLD